MKHITQNFQIKAKLLALLFLLLSINLTHATQTHSQGSTLKLMLPSAVENIVFFDNIKFTGIYNNFTMDQLNPGNHRIKIIQIFVSGRGRYEVVNRTILYNGFLFVPAFSKVFATIYGNGRLRIDNTIPNNNRGYYNGNGYYNNQNGNRHQCERNDDFEDDRSGSNFQNSDERSNNHGYNFGNGNSTNRSDNIGNFALIINAIKKQSFDSDRLKIAKNALTENNMRSSEIAEITKLFSFETTRLDFAKYAYTYTTDKNNYVMVQDAFQFQTSTSELQDYITQMGHH